MSVSRASGMPCGSVFGRVRVLLYNFIESHADAFKRCAAQLTFQSFDRELLGRHVARYSAVFVFYNRKS